MQTVYFHEHLLTLPGRADPQFTWRFSFHVFSHFFVFVFASCQQQQMLKDLDLADSSVDCKKIRLAAGCKKRLMAELKADSGFLSGLGVMDYSLLVSFNIRCSPIRSLDV